MNNFAKFQKCVVVSQEAPARIQDIGWKGMIGVILAFQKYRN